MDFVANKPLHECLYHICVERNFLPEGLPRIKDRGECCAPCSTRNISKHTWKIIFEWFFKICVMSKKLPLLSHDTRKLDFENLSFLVLHSRFCIIRHRRTWFSMRKHYWKIVLLRISPCMNAKNTFALNWIFGPKGAPEQTTKESAAHHFLVETYLNIPEKPFSKEFSTLVVCRISGVSWAKIPGNWASIFYSFGLGLHESAPSNIEELNFQSEMNTGNQFCS